MTWALALRKTDLENPAARHVLLCLANYAGSDGRGAFPSANTLSEDTGLSERTVRLKLDELEKAGFIAEGNQAIAAAYIDRRDRRPVVYDLQMKRGANAAPRKDRGADNGTGCSSKQNGVQENAERGAAAAPNPSLNHQGTEEQLQREFADEVAEQERQAAECRVDQRFAMFAAWVPPAKSLADQIAIAGLVGEGVPDAAVRKFKGFHVAKPNTVDTAAGWCYRLVQWVKRERAVAAGQGKAPDFDDTSWGDDLGGL
ncbi:helix-turn-helix domain-containing protein [Pseudomonas putida]|uniref:helix-turn-helix domain-containing protein n=1 Tax=Pseudomonas putida TaxID=303 RepID=UPI00236320B1|nr:helix-turn-helix domain-containing protein [Pseudomonas putida]MDD1966970.1 helix-turn-helix domain-containing protein [Pseudomonas putida]